MSLTMSVEAAIALVFALGILVYLVYTLLRPDRF